MAEIIFRLPAKTVTYGYVEVHTTPEELNLDPALGGRDLGAAYRLYADAFQKGEREGAGVKVPSSTPEPSEAPSGPLQGASPRTLEQVMSDKDVDTVAEAQKILEKELGATEIDTEPAPWSGTVEPTVKPWEQGNKTAAPKAAASNNVIEW